MSLDERVRCVVELPRGTPGLSGAEPLVVHTGFVRDTLMDDGGALEALVHGGGSAVPGQELEAGVAGLARTASGARLLAVAGDEPEVPPDVRSGIERMLGGQVAWEGREQALAALYEARARYAMASVGPAEE